MILRARAARISGLLMSITLLAFGTGLCSDVEIPLPEGAVASFGLGSAYDIALSPDGRYLAVATSCGIELRDKETMELLRFLYSPAGAVYHIAYSPDGEHIALTQRDGSIGLWRVDGASESPTTLPGHGESATALAYSSGGQLLASGSRDNTVKVWDVATGEELRTFEGHTGPVYSVDFSPGGRLLASGSGDGTVRLWDVDTGRIVNTLRGHTSAVVAICFSPDGELLASGSRDKTAKLWDVSSGSEIASLCADCWGYVSAVAFSSDGRTLAFDCWDSSGDTIRLWDVATKTVTDYLSGGYHLEALAFSTDGEMLVSSYSCGKIKMWEVATGREVRTLDNHGGAVDVVKFSPDGHSFASASYYGSIELRDTATGDQTLRLSCSSPRALAFSRDGRLLASGCGYYSEAHVWDAVTGEHLRTLDHSLDEYRVLSLVISVAFSPDDRLLATSAYVTIKLWETSSGTEVRTLTGHEGSIGSVTFSPDGRLLASCSNDRTIRIWEVATGEELRALEGHTDSVHSVDLSPDGQLLASCSSDRTIRLWNLETGAQVCIYEGHTDSVNGVAFRPDGQLLASCSNDGTVRIWEVATGEQLRAIEGHTNDVNSVGFSLDGRLLSSGSRDGRVLLWDVSSVPAPPRITSVEALQSVLVGADVPGTIGFRDLNADLAEAQFEILEGDSMGFVLDVTQPPYADSVDGMTEGEFAFELGVDVPGSYRFQVTLIDVEGLESAPVEFSFEAVSPDPPATAHVIFPTSIAMNQAQHGVVRFEDPDGDIVLAQFEVQEGDPSAIEVQPGTSFDPGVHGQTDGAFRFTITSSAAQRVTLRLTLVDEAGLESDPYEFTFEVQ